MNYVLPTLADVKEQSNKKLFNVVSLFAGAGGSSTGYRLAGGNVLAINEFIQEARDTYRANYPETHIFEDDIRNITGQMILDKIGLQKGELDILDGSPPCSAFSSGGLREEGWGKEKNYSSNVKQVVDDLFFEYVRVLKDLMPKVFIAENVDALTMGKASSLLGNDKQMDFFGDIGVEKPKTILDEFANCGYEVAYMILNACNYGVPQARKRIFIIGIRNDLNKKPVFPKKFNYIVTSEEAFASIDYDDEQIQMLLSDAKRYKWGEYLKQLPKDIDKVIYANRILGGGSYMSLARICRRKPSPTMAQRSQVRDTAGLCHYVEDRKLSIQEMKRLQSFPDDFQLTGNFNQQAERICRSVPPLLMKAIAETVYKEILV